MSGPHPDSATNEIHRLVDHVSLARSTADIVAGGKSRDDGVETHQFFRVDWIAIRVLAHRELSTR